MSTPSPIPDDFHTVTAYLIVDGAAEALTFYQKAFHAEERMRLPVPDGDGKLGHAEMRIGNSIVMIADEFPDMLCRSPKHYGGSPVSFVIYVEDADVSFHHAVEAGCTVAQPLETKFYGERAGTVQDPYGFQWTLMTHVEDVSQEELERRMKAEFENARGDA